MANYVGAIEKFNPYIQQIPTEAYTKVGMYKESEYGEGVKKVQDTVDQIAGLDIANEGGRNYLKNRVSELTQNLNKYSRVDFSNPNNVTQLQSLASPLYQDENIISDVLSTITYRNWDKTSKEKLQKGDMDVVQYYYEKQDASKWLSSDTAGSPYTGRNVPNDATYEKVAKQFLDFKSKLKPDTRYTPGSGEDQVWMYGEKSYNTEQLKEFFYNNILDGNSKEMLMHNTMYNDTGRYNLDTNNPKKDLISIYSKKKDRNEQALKQTELQITAFGDNKLTKDQQEILKQNKAVYEGNIDAYDKAIKNFSQLDPLDPSHKISIYTNLSSEYYKDALTGMFEYEQLEPKYREDTKQSREHANARVTAALAKGTIVGSISPESHQFEIRGVFEEDGITPALIEKQSDLITTVDKDGNTVTTKKASKAKGKAVDPASGILEGRPGEMANVNIAGADKDRVNVTQEGLQKEYNSQDEVIKSHIINMTNTLSKLSTSGFNTKDYYDIVSEVKPPPEGDGRIHKTISWKNEGKKKEFLKFIDTLNSAYNIEKADNNLDNESFQKMLNGELALTSAELGLKGVDPKALTDVIGLKGNVALLGQLKSLFKDETVLNDFIGIDNAIAEKIKIASPLREVLKRSVKDNDEYKTVNTLSDDEIVNGFYNLTSDGTYSGTPIDAPWYKKLFSGPFARSGEEKKPILSEGTIDRAKKRLEKEHSVLVQNITSSVSLLSLPENKQDLLAVTQAIQNSLVNQGGSSILSDKSVIDFGNLEGVKGIVEVTNITGAGVKAEGDFFNNLGKLNITAKVNVQGKNNEVKQVETTATFDVNRILATDPGFTSKFSKYFSNLKYAKEGAAIRLQSAIVPLNEDADPYRKGDYNKNKTTDGSHAPEYTGGLGKDFSSFVATTSDGQKVPFQYKIAPIEESGVISYEVMQQVNLPSGPVNIFLKSGDGKNIRYANPEAALYTLKDELYTKVPMDNKSQMIKIPQKDGTVKYAVNYFSEFDSKAPSARSFLNSQLRLNGISVPNLEEIKQAYADIMAGKSTEIDKKLLQFTPLY